MHDETLVICVTAELHDATVRGMSSERDETLVICITAKHGKMTSAVASG